MRVVYLAHPLSAPTRGGVDANRARAARWCAWAARHGVAPVADWIILSGEWPETPENRSLGLRIDCALVARCDELWLVGGRISSGMKVEANAARDWGVAIVDLTELGEEPPTDEAFERWLGTRSAP